MRAVPWEASIPTNTPRGGVPSLGETNHSCGFASGHWFSGLTSDYLGGALGRAKPRGAEQASVSHLCQHASCWRSLFLVVGCPKGIVCVSSSVTPHACPGTGQQSSFSEQLFKAVSMWGLCSPGRGWRAQEGNRQVGGAPKLEGPPMALDRCPERVRSTGMWLIAFLLCQDPKSKDRKAGNSGAHLL